MDKINEIKEALKELVNEENASKIAEIGTKLDAIDSEHTKLSKDYGELKDSYIGIVKNTSLAQSHKDTDIENTPKSLDEIMIEEAQKVLEKK